MVSETVGGGHSGRACAVAILVVDRCSCSSPSDDENMSVLVSRRISRRDAEKGTYGQLALPGGKVEECDGSAFEAARRELYEETGLQFDKKSFILEDTLSTEEWNIEVMSVMMTEDKRSCIQCREPDKHGMWHWRSWQGLKALAQESTELFAPLKIIIDRLDVMGSDNPDSSMRKRGAGNVS
jgi:8-oxo-dGTP pyrophosphatase MutT (NUDIX family)